jgi:hypothetical protein
MEHLSEWLSPQAKTQHMVLSKDLKVTIVESMTVSENLENLNNLLRGLAKT